MLRKRKNVALSTATSKLDSTHKRNRTIQVQVLVHGTHMKLLKLFIQSNSTFKALQTAELEAVPAILKKLFAVAALGAPG